MLGRCITYVFILTAKFHCFDIAVKAVNFVTIGVTAFRILLQFLTFSLFLITKSFDGPIAVSTDDVQLYLSFFCCS